MSARKMEQNNETQILTQLFNTTTRCRC